MQLCPYASFTALILGLSLKKKKNDMKNALFFIAGAVVYEEVNILPTYLIIK